MSGADLLSFSVPEGKEKKCWVVGCILVLWCKAGFFLGGGRVTGGGGGLLYVFPWTARL